MINLIKKLRARRIKKALKMIHYAAVVHQEYLEAHKARKPATNNMKTWLRHLELEASNKLNKLAG